jgi:hypothetical protein
MLYQGLLAVFLGLAVTVRGARDLVIALLRGAFRTKPTVKRERSPQDQH